MGRAVRARPSLVHLTASRGRLTQTAARRRDAAARPSALTDVAIAAFLWAFRIVVILVVVVGSMLTLASGKLLPRDLDQT